MSFTDPTGHSVDCTLGEDDCEDTRIEDESAIENENPGFFSLSIGVDTPTIVIISGAIICIVAPEVGLPVIAAGIALEESLIKPLSFGGVFTIDTFGNIYAGPEISYGKVLTPFIGGSLNFGGIIRDESQPVITESESEDFFQGFAVNAGTIATGGIIFSPFAENKFAYYLTGLPEIISVNVSYSWMIRDANP